MHVIAWRAWYAGGASYCSSGTSWDELPDDGVLGVVTIFSKRAPNGARLKRMIDGRDWYWRAPGLDGEPIYGFSDDDPDEIRDRYPGAELKRGKWTSDPEMSRVMAEMNAWTVE